MFPQLGPMEMMMVMGVAVLLFGKRLPEVGRSLGKGIIEFKKGLAGSRTSSIKQLGRHQQLLFELWFGSRDTTTSRVNEPMYNDTSVPKFEVPAPVGARPQMEYQQPHD